MKNKINLEKLDKQLQKKGWKFLGPILHYEKAWKGQASVYEKNGKYIVYGIDRSGEKILNCSISKSEAEKKLKKSLIEISKYMLQKSI